MGPAKCKLLLATQTVQTPKVTKANQVTRKLHAFFGIFFEDQPVFRLGLSMGDIFLGVDSPFSSSIVLSKKTAVFRGFMEVF